MKKILASIAMLGAVTAHAQISHENIDQAAAELQPQVVEWRRWFHENPELSNREFKTAEMI